jgi:hypothetical protein
LRVKTENNFQEVHLIENVFKKVKICENGSIEVPVKQHFVVLGSLIPEESVKWAIAWYCLAPSKESHEPLTTEDYGGGVA